MQTVSQFRNNRDYLTMLTNEKTLKALIEAGAVKRIHIITRGALIHVEVDTINGSLTAATIKGALKTWSSIDSAAKWTRSLGIGKLQLDVEKWQPQQKALRL